MLFLSVFVKQKKVQYRITTLLGLNTDLAGADGVRHLVFNGLYDHQVHVDRP